jgi:hypothetical protein
MTENAKSPSLLSTIQTTTSALPSSEKRFPDGAEYRIEIPSVEGPSCLEAVLSTAAELDVVVHRVSQGSGVFLLTDRELRSMVATAAAGKVEVSLFARPNASWTTSAMARSAAGAAMVSTAWGSAQVAACLDDIERAAATARVLADLGADTLNLPTDLPLSEIAAIRAAVDIPLDVYIEAPDNVGGFVRHHELPELIRVAAPVYLKFGLRNAPDIYPSGTHLEATAVSLSVERVRRARLGVELLARSGFTGAMSALAAKGLAVPSASSTSFVAGLPSVPLFADDGEGAHGER